MDRRTLGGVILVVLGLAMLAAQFFQGLGDSIFFFVIGGFFLFGYFQRQTYGLLIPGGILIGLGLGAVAEQTWRTMDGISTIGLGLGFVSIFVIDRAFQGKSHWWPLVPGGILILSGLATSSQLIQRWMEVGWPLILLGLGLALLLGMGGRSR